MAKMGKPSGAGSAPVVKGAAKGGSISQKGVKMANGAGGSPKAPATKGSARGGSIEPMRGKEKKGENKLKKEK